MRQLFQDLIRPQRRVNSSNAFLPPLEPRTPSCLIHFGHRVPFILPPINGITTITSAGQDGPFGTALGTEAGLAARQFCLERKGKKKMRQKKLLQMDASLGVQDPWPWRKGAAGPVQSHFLLTSLVSFTMAGHVMAPSDRCEWGFSPVHRSPLSSEDGKEETQRLWGAHICPALCWPVWVLLGEWVSLTPFLDETAEAQGVQNLLCVTQLIGSSSGV